MALTESIEYDKIEIVGIYKAVQVRKATVIKRDNVEISGSRSFERYTLQSGTLKGGVKADGITPADDADDFVNNPLDKEPDGVTAIPAEVSAICTAAWTTDVKAALKAKLIADKSGTP